MTWVTLVDGITADADELMSDFYHVAQGDLLPRGGTTFTPTTGVYDLGSSAYRWNRMYVNEIASTCTVSGQTLINVGPVIFNVPPVFSGAAFVRLNKMVVEHHMPSGNTPVPISGNYNYATATALNTVTVNQITGATLSSYQITLPSGSYLCSFQVPLTAVLGYMSRAILFNVTASTTAAAGSIIGCQVSAYSTCLFESFTLLTTSALEIRCASSYPATTVALSSMDVSYGEPEIFSRVFIYGL
jgi:hypothetical protein